MPVWDDYSCRDCGRTFHSPLKDYRCARCWRLLRTDNAKRAKRDGRGRANPPARAQQKLSTIGQRREIERLSGFPARGLKHVAKTQATEVIRNLHAGEATTIRASDGRELRLAPIVRAQPKDSVRAYEGPERQIATPGLGEKAQPPERFEAGDRVRSIQSGRIGWVLRDGGDLVSVTFQYSANPELVPPQSLAAFPESQVELMAAPDFLSSLTAYKLSSQLSNYVYGYLASRTQFRPYQFLPVLRFLRSPVRRLLIADEVGLGKTIEAGLVWLELLSRNQAERILVVCPSHLREKWRRELLSRFDIDATIIHTGSQLDAIIRDLEAAPSEVEKSRSLIVSLRMLAMPYGNGADEVSRAEALVDGGVIWDLVVVDEAHHARNTSTRSHQALEALTPAVEAQLFLTATPLNLGTPDLFNLLRLLHPDRFVSFDAFEDQLGPASLVTNAVRQAKQRDLPAVKALLRELGEGVIGQRLTQTHAYQTAMSIIDDDHNASDHRALAQLELSLRELHPLAGVFTRTRKRDLTEPFAKRDVRRVPVSWTPEEVEFYDAVLDLVQLETARNPFAIVMPARQSASCLPAMIARIEEGDWTYDPGEGEERVGNSGLSAQPTAQDRAWQRVQRAVEGVSGKDTKYGEFRRILRELFQGEVRQVLVFSFFRRTLSYLSRRLRSDGYDVGTINGSVPLDERQRIMDRFRDGEIQILLSSEVGSEGLDFEFCACLVNYDLPWNPMRVEQRIGRLDRFGQQHERIIIVNFEIPGTIETDIFDRLYQRIGVFVQSIGDLDDILGEELEDKAFEIARELRLTEAERNQRIEQLAINFEKRRQVVEDLESHRELLAASEELLSEELENIRASGRYVDPAETEALVWHYLTRHHPDSQWAEVRPGVYELKLGAQFGTNDPISESGVQSGLHPHRVKASQDTPIWVTFDQEVALRETHLEFLTGRHPIVSAIATASAPSSLPIATSLAVNSDAAPPGLYAAILYEATLRGVDDRRFLFPIIVDQTSLARSTPLESALLGILARARADVSGGSSGIDAGAVAAAQQHAAKEGQSIETEARVENELAFERRLQATIATYEPKIEAAKSTVRQTLGTRVEAANRARLQKLEDRYRVAVQDLESSRSVEVTLRELGHIAVEVSSDRSG